MTLNPFVAAKTSLAVLAATIAVQIVVLVRPAPAPAANELPLVDFGDAIELSADATEKLHSTDPDARSDGAQELIALLEAGWPDDHRREFLVAVGPHALRTAVDHCVPPSVTIGQAVLESGWGRSGLATDHNNLFGVKAGRSKKAVSMRTTEYEGGRAGSKQQRFRTYEGWGDSLDHHGKLLGSDHRYADAREHWDHWPLFLKTVAPVYATDPAYVARVSQLVKTYRLDEFDALVSQIARKRSDCASY